ncbi:MAG: HAMP domain-containing histidine kinase [Anaerolineae bacterium]|nr:HAMP domain-containing histidine kinase [Anaerolineae bacterium]
MKRLYGIALLPVAAGLVIVVLVKDVPTLSNPILYVRADLATWVMIGTTLLSGLVAAGGLLWDWRDGKNKREIAQMRTQAAEDHRRFLQRLDHELKNPLTAIRAGLANATNGSTTPDQQEALASVETQVVRLSRLTADLRKLAELETRPLERVPVNIAELLEELISLAQEQPQAVARKLTLTLSQVPWPVPDVPGDWDMLFLAVYNLIGNALKFTRPGDAIEIRAFEDGAFVVIEVADTGPGIPEDELPRVWDELYRGQGARGIPGSGLGLALVRAIVERHGGQAMLRSRAGQGTVMTMRLPIM